MNAARIRTAIQMIETTLGADTGEMSEAQIANLNDSLAGLRERLGIEAQIAEARMHAIEAAPEQLTIELPEAPRTEGKMIGREFVTAGKAIFTFSNATGERYTFKISAPDNFRGEYFASVMKGTDNENDYRYVGMMSGAGLTLRTTKASRFPEASKEFRVLAFALDIIAQRRALPAGYDLRHAGRCGRCGRTLTTPESIDRGIGPDCADQMGIAA